MSDAEKKELKALCESVKELDENGRKVVKIATEALLARQSFEGIKDERKAEERSSAECTDGTHAEL